MSLITKKALLFMDMGSVILYPTIIWLLLPYDSLIHLFTSMMFISKMQMGKRIVTFHSNLGQS